MKVLGLIYLGLELILASNPEDAGWSISVTRHINATQYKDVIIWCNFTYSPLLYKEDIGVYWKKLRSGPVKFNEDKNAFIFHPDSNLVLKKYRGKTSLIGNKDKGNCSLMIRNITDNETDIYLRVIAKGDQYSFILNHVSISVNGTGVDHAPLTRDIANTPSPTFDSGTTTETSTTDTPSETSGTIYMVIFVPVSALLIIISVVGIVLWIKHRRSNSSTRQDSGYYANFSRASSNQAKRDAPGKKQEDQKFPEPKVIDEPVYVNLEAPPDQMDPTMDEAQNIYANVDYHSK